MSPDNSTTEQGGRVIGRPFEAGQSGNPGGRPRGLAEVEEAARKHTPAAIATLAMILADVSAKAIARVRAAEVLLDRGWGRTRQVVEFEGEVAHHCVINARPMSNEEWLQTYAPKLSSPEPQGMDPKLFGNPSQDPKRLS